MGQGQDEEEFYPVLSTYEWLQKMLRGLGIQPFWLLPPTEFDNIPDQEYYGLYSPYPQMDLEIFDNTDFDCR